jgi:Tol biopolymer transport system component
LLQRFIGSNSQPEWTPDGRYFAYVSQRGSKPTNGVARVVGIRDTKTGEERELRPKLLYFVTLSWSPAGDALVTSGTDIKGKDGVFRIDAQTGEVTLIAESTVNGYPRWSPDGSSVFYRKGAQGQFADFALVEHRLASGAERELARGEIGVFSVSPDGRSIVAPFGGLAGASAQTIVEINVDTGQMRELFRAGQSERIPPYIAPRWLPDGTAVLVRKRSPNEIWLVPKSGAAPRRLDLDVHDWSFGAIGQFSVHPDGKRIAFLSGNLSNEVMALKRFLSAPSLSRPAGQPR